MLEYTRAAVTRNQSEKKINSLLDHVAASTDMRLLQVLGLGWALGSLAVLLAVWDRTALAFMMFDKAAPAHPAQTCAYLRSGLLLCLWAQVSCALANLLSVCALR